MTNRTPRAGMETTELPEIDFTQAVSPLAAYFKATGITPTAFCKATGLDHKVVRDHINGRSLPNLVTAYYYEIVTRGIVAMEMWLATAMAKARFQEMMERANEEIQRQVAVLPGGGMAAPVMEKKSNGKSNKNTKKEE